MLTEPSRPDPSRAGIVPICCTMLPFATFIDTRGLGMSWDIFKSPSTQNFWHKCRHCIWSLLVPICCTMLPFATFIDTGGLEYCWESHETFLGKSFHLNFLARVPALQSTGRPKSCCSFTKMSFLSKFFTKFIFDQDFFLLDLFS